MLYCSKQHQAADRDNHKLACNAVKKHRDRLEREEQALRANPGDGFWMTADVFTSSVGHFWGIHDTRDYMRARYRLIEATLEIKTFDAVKSALDHTMDILRLNRSDNMGVRNMVPAMLLRLGRDQECYDFVKWYETMGQARDYDWGDMSLPFLDIANANVLESAEYLGAGRGSLSHISAITLLKIKLLLDLRSLQASALLAAKVPSEIVGEIQRFVPRSTIITMNKAIMGGQGLGSYIADLTLQVDMLYAAVEKENKNFWPALLNPERHLNARPETYQLGSLEETQILLKHSLDAWTETPGALEMIEAKFEG